MAGLNCGIPSKSEWEIIKRGCDGVIKINDSGFIEWGRKFSNDDSDFGYSCVSTLDGGYAITGSTFNLGNGNKDFGDLWLLKTDEKGVAALPSN